MIEHRVNATSEKRKMKTTNLKVFVLKHSAAKAIPCCVKTLDDRFKDGRLKPDAILVGGICRDPQPLIDMDNIETIRQSLICAEPQTKV